MDLVLQKLDSKISWKKMPKDNVLVSDLTSAFGRWKTSGRLDRVLTYLEESRKPPDTPS